MTTRTKAIIITVIGAVATFAIGPMIWQPAIGGPAPAGMQLPLFIFLSALESVAFGLGLAFLILGWPYIKNLAAPSRATAMTLYLAIGWYLVSWWPHDNMHISNGDNLWRLIRIEYIFHFTLIVAAIAMAACFFDILKHHPRLAQELKAK